jgi:hypothetical protein
MFIAGLQFAGTLSIDSQVKNERGKATYSEVGALHYAHWLTGDPERLTRWSARHGGQETLELNGHQATITEFETFLNVDIPDLQFMATLEK